MTLITPDDVRKVSKLARLEISEEDIDIYAEQIEKILEYIVLVQLPCKQIISPYRMHLSQKISSIHRSIKTKLLSS